MGKEAFLDPGMFCKLFLVPDLACDFPFVLTAAFSVITRCLPFSFLLLLFSSDKTILNEPAHAASE